MSAVFLARADTLARAWDRQSPLPDPFVDLPARLNRYGHLRVSPKDPNAAVMLERKS